MSATPYLQSLGLLADPPDETPPSTPEPSRLLHSLQQQCAPFLALKPRGADARTHRPLALRVRVQMAESLITSRVPPTGS